MIIHVQDQKKEQNKRTAKEKGRWATLLQKGEEETNRGRREN